MYFMGIRDLRVLSTLEYWYLVCTLCLPTMHTNYDPVQVLLHSNGHLGAKHLGVQDYATVHSMCAGANVNSQCMYNVYV